MLAGLAAFLLSSQGRAGEAFPEAQVKVGRGLYSQNCSPCHGPQMQDPDIGSDLRKFPRDDRARFFNSVSNGKPPNMPPWRSMLSAEDIASLWAYVVAGEPR